MRRPADVGTPGTPMVLKFSDPSKPGTVKFHVMWGDAVVTAADTQEVTILANVNRKSPPAKRTDGLRRLDSEVTYTAAEKNNVISIDVGGETPYAAPGARFNVTVPRNTSIVVKNSMGGNATVVGISGDVEIHSLNGEVALENINGAAQVETMNGEIHATFTKVPEGKPLSFTSMNGEIEVRIPADTKANVRLRTQNGAVYTDFDDKALVTKTEAERGHLTIRHKPNPHPHVASSDGDDDEFGRLARPGPRGRAGRRRGRARGDRGGARRG